MQRSSHNSRTERDTENWIRSTWKSQNERAQNLLSDKCCWFFSYSSSFIVTWVRIHAFFNKSLYIKRWPLLKQQTKHWIIWCDFQNPEEICFQIHVLTFSPIFDRYVLFWIWNMGKTLIFGSNIVPPLYINRKMFFQSFSATIPFLLLIRKRYEPAVFAKSLKI